MAQEQRVKIIFDPSVNSLTVWFGSPGVDYVATQLADDLVILKNADGDVLGFEKHFFAAAPGEVNVQLETLSLLNPADFLHEPAV